MAEQHPSVHDHDDSASLNSMPGEFGGVPLGRLLGEGGMGRVYFGHHPILDVDVAIKVMLHRRGDGDRFLTEARLAARVQHPHIVRILHAGDEEGYRYLILEYVPGRNLKQVVRERGRLPWREAAGHLLDAARGLAEAHRVGIIHRDIKPSNLLLDGAGRIKVADLGLARALIGSEQDAAAEAVEAFDSIVGTPQYMAPEQAFEPHRVTPAADVYGLGSTFHVLLTGEVPFPKSGLRDLLKRHREGAVPDPRLLVPDLPDAVRDFAMRLMAKEPAQRPSDGAAVVSELERLLGLATASTTWQREANPAPRRRLWWGAAAAAAGLAGVGTILVGWAHGDESVPHPAAVAPPPAVVPAPAAVQAMSATPPRAVFILAGTLPAAAQAGLTEAGLASGLPLVERARIDALVGEQRLLHEGRVDPLGGIQLGRLVGGHIALFADPVEDRVELRCVLVETGEIVASRLVAPAEVGATATSELASATALLPLRAAVEQRPAGTTVNAGSRHGLHQGDRLVLRRGAAGPELATATVTALTADHASLAVEPAGTDLTGAIAVRQAP